jgi:hypothetical protein
LTKKYGSFIKLDDDDDDDDWKIRCAAVLLFCLARTKLELQLVDDDDDGLLNTILEEEEEMMDGWMDGC